VRFTLTSRELRAARRARGATLTARAINEDSLGGVGTTATIRVAGPLAPKRAAKRRRG
jgi:hypothetical protein